MLSRVAYFIRETSFRVGHFCSGFCNMVFFSGHIHQSISARAHVSAPRSPKWSQRCRLINRIFFWQEDHCAKARRDEVERAKLTLSLDE